LRFSLLRPVRPVITFLLALFVAAHIFLLGYSAAKARGFPEQESRTSVGASPLMDSRKLLADGHVREAEATVRVYLSEHQNSSDAHFLLGLILFREIQAEALESSGPQENDEASKNQTASFREEKAKASLAEYTEGAKYERPDASDLKFVALDYVLLGSYSDASKWLTRSVEKDPSDAEAWYFLGRTKYNENRFEDAVRAFERCLALEPRNVKAQSNLGLSYAGLNRVTDAEKAFLKAIEWQAGAQRKNGEAYIGLGDLLIQQNRASEAVSYLQQAIEIAPRESRAHEKLGNAYLNLSQLPAAQDQLETAVGLDPENPSLHYLLGSIYRKQGRSEKATAEFQRFEALKRATEPPRP